MQHINAVHSTSTLYLKNLLKNQRSVSLKNQYIIRHFTVSFMSPVNNNVTIFPIDFFISVITFLLYCFTKSLFRTENILLRKKEIIFLENKFKIKYTMVFASPSEFSVSTLQLGHVLLEQRNAEVTVRNSRSGGPISEIF